MNSPELLRISARLPELHDAERVTRRPSICPAMPIWEDRGIW